MSEDLGPSPEELGLKKESQRHETKPLQASVESRASSRHPERNEDSFVLDQQSGLFAVFDGVSTERGSEAAALAKAYFEKSLHLRGRKSLQEITFNLKHELEQAHRLIMAQGEKEGARLTTTASVVKIWENNSGERTAVIGNVGDSRVYILHRDGNLDLLTQDDGAAQARGSGKELQEKLDQVTDPSSLTPEELDLYRQRNIIYRALGMPGLTVSVSTAEIKGGDKIIITSDGIHDNLTRSEISQIAGQAKTADESSNSLIEAAWKRSLEGKLRSKADDMTALVIEVPSEINLGDTIELQRSSGAIESDWKIMSIDANTNEITAVKN